MNAGPLFAETSHTLARLSLHVTDMAGQQDTLEFEVRDASQPLSATNLPVSVNSRSDRWARVGPGTYWLVPRDRPEWIQRVTVASNQTADVDVPAPQALWLSIPRKNDQPAQRVLLSLKTTEKLRAAIGRLRPTGTFRSNIGMLRPNVPPDQLAAALALARKQMAITAINWGFPPGATKEEKQRLLELRVRVRNYAARILAAAGEAEDAKLLLKRSDELAYLEMRLGLIERGQLLEMARTGISNNVFYAGTQLRLAGVNAADALLRRYIAEHPKECGNAAVALLDDASPETLATMRGLWRALTSPGHKREWATIPAALYLLAYGDKSDWQRIGSTDLPQWASYWFMFVAEDPRPLADLQADNEVGLAEVATALRDFPAARAAEYAKYFEDAVYRSRAKPGMRAAELAPAQTAVATYLAYVSFCRPNETLARFFFNERVSLADVPWCPALWRKKELYDNLLKGGIGWSWQDHFDVLPHAELVKDLESRGAREKLPDLDLLLARHLVTTRAFCAARDNYRDGIERRPFTVRSPEKEGAISSVMEVRPQFVGNTLRFTLRCQSAAHYQVSGFLDFHDGVRERWPHHKYAINAGKEFIADLRLRRSAQTFPAKLLGYDSSGALVYEAALDRANFTGLFLDVDLQFFEQHHQIIFDLFASDAARDARKGVVADPNDPDTFSNAGQHDKAAALLRQQLQKSGEDAGLWSDLALELYLARSYKDAAAASAKAVALAPDDGDAKVMAALCAFLAGDAKAAEQFASAVPEDVQPERAQALWYIAGKSEKAAAALTKLRDATTNKKLQESLDALLGRANPEPKLDPSFEYVAQCRTFCYAGYRRLLDGRNDEAKKYFAEALKTLQMNRPEFRLAQVALERLPK